MGLRGFPADAFFGASPVVASALGFRLGATPRGPFNITRTFADGPPKGTFLLCWGRGHFYFAATGQFWALTAAHRFANIA
jgi:hypothetical protein